MRAVVISGWRGPRHAPLPPSMLKQLHDVLGQYVKSDDVIYEGGARGIDFETVRWATNRHIQTRPFPAHWETLGKRAGMERNKVMLHTALRMPQQLLLAFPHPKLSVGTYGCIELAEKLGIQVVRTILVEK